MTESNRPKPGRGFQSEQPQGPETLEEGVDFVYDEKGCFVLTKAYFSKREQQTQNPDKKDRKPSNQEEKNNETKKD